MAERRTQQQRREEAETALLDAAIELISEQGIIRTSLAQIGTHAGYSHGLVNHHFGSKEQLIERLIHRSRQRFMDRSREAAHENGLNRLLKAVDFYLSPYENSSNQNPYLMIMWGSSLPEKAPHHKVMADFEAGARAIAKRTIELGQEDGSISESVDPDSIACLFMGMMRGCASQLLLRPHNIKPRKLRAQIKQTLRAALEV